MQLGGESVRVATEVATLEMLGFEQSKLFSPDLVLLLKVDWDQDNFSYQSLWKRIFFNMRKGAIQPRMPTVRAISEMTPRLVGVKSVDAPIDTDIVSVNESHTIPSALGSWDECSSVKDLTGSFSCSSLSM